MPRKITKLIYFDECAFLERRETDLTNQKPATFTLRVITIIFGAFFISYVDRQAMVNQELKIECKVALTKTMRLLPFKTKHENEVLSHIITINIRMSTVGHTANSNTDI